MLKEMTLREKSEELLRLNELKNRHIIEALPDTVIQIAGDGTVLDYKSKHNDFLRLVVGKNVCDSLPSDIVQEFLKYMNIALNDGASQQVDLMFHEESVACFLVFNFVKSDANEVTVFMRDITKRKKYEEQLEHLSTHDVLTGLYNRTFYEAELDRLATSRRYPVSIIVIDLDGLKNTNDTYGHAAGDKIICKAANILTNAFRAEDLVARTGGDEFAVLLPETGADSVNISIERIQRCLEEANRVDDGFEVNFSVGVAIAETKEKLLGAVKIADSRMYQNKAERKTLASKLLATENYSEFTPTALR